MLRNPIIRSSKLYEDSHQAAPRLRGEKLSDFEPSLALSAVFILGVVSEPRTARKGGRNRDSAGYIRYQSSAARILGETMVLFRMHDLAIQEVLDDTGTPQSEGCDAYKAENIVGTPGGEWLTFITLAIFLVA